MKLAESIVITAVCVALYAGAWSLGIGIVLAIARAL